MRVYGVGAAQGAILKLPGSSGTPRRATRRSGRASRRSPLHDQVSFSEALEDAQRTLSRQPIRRPTTRADGSYVMPRSDDAEREATTQRDEQPQQAVARPPRVEATLREIVLTTIIIASVLLAGSIAAYAAL